MRFFIIWCIVFFSCMGASLASLNQLDPSECQMLEILRKKSVPVKLSFAQFFSLRESPSHFFLISRNSFSPTVTVAKKASMAKVNSFCGPQKMLVLYRSIKSMASYSSTVLYPLDFFGKQEILKGLLDLQYVYSPWAKKAIGDGRIKELRSIKEKEILLSLQPDLILYFHQWPRHLLPFSLVMESFKERHPLGRAEWILFYGVLFFQFAKAKKHFQEIVANYRRIKGEKRGSGKKILWGILNRDRFIPISQGSMGRMMLEDLGTSLLYQDQQSVHLEQLARLRDQKSLIWIMHDLVLSRHDLPRSARVLEKAHFFNNNKRRSQRGGGDFWETGIFRPDLVLEDISKMIQGHSKNLFFYQEIF